MVKPFASAESIGVRARGNHAVPHPLQRCPSSYVWASCASMPITALREFISFFKVVVTRLTHSYIRLSQVATRGKLPGPQNVTIPSIITTHGQWPWTNIHSECVWWVSVSDCSDHLGFTGDSDFLNRNHRVSSHNPVSVGLRQNHCFASS